MFRYYCDLPIGQLKAMEPVSALRQCFIVRCGSLQNAYHKLDKNGDGVLSRKEFQEGLQNLTIPWDKITDCKSEDEVFALIDVDDSGQIDLSEFLGFPDSLGVDCEKLTGEERQEHLWKNYYTRALERRAFKAEPKWHQIEQNHRAKVADPAAFKRAGLQLQKEKAEIRKKGTETRRLKAWGVGQIKSLQGVKSKNII